MGEHAGIKNIEVTSPEASIIHISEAILQLGNGLPAIYG